MNEDLCTLINNVYSNISNSANGGVISINANKNLYIFWCLFNKCKATGSNSGGGVFFQSSKSFFSNRNCAFECSAYSGYFIFIKGALKSVVAFNSTMTTKCSGTDRGVFFSRYSNVFSRDYNSTHCESGVHCNVHSFYNEITEAKFYHFYKNKQDIIFGVNSFGDKHRISYVSFIMNEVSQRLYGYIHTNDYANEVLSVSNMYAYENQHKLINPEKGMIIIKYFYGNDFSCTGNEMISTDIISIEKSFKMITKFKHVLVCKRTKAKPVNLINTSSNIIFLFLFVAISSYF